MFVPRFGVPDSQVYPCPNGGEKGSSWVDSIVTKMGELFTISKANENSKVM
jgi:hypothetical protein